MPFGARRRLAIALCLGLGLGAAQAASAQDSGGASTWTDPPARKAEPAKPDVAAPRPERPAAVSTATPRATARKVAQRPERKATRRVEARPRRIVVAATPRHHVAVARRPVRVAAAPMRPPVVYRAYPAYPTQSAAGYAPVDEDDRLSRLSTAAHSGYLVVRRRTVEYPDGRVIRFYRPAEDAWDE